jgi:(hydroxyamino)benzene mutase
MQRLLFALGLILFVLGLVTGLVIPALKNPRMGLASHLQGMTNGPFLIVVGLLWPHLALAHVWQVVAVALLAYGTYANWLATQLAAIWGAGAKFAPGAAGGHAASGGKETIVNVLLVSLAPATIAASIILLVGVLR